VPALLEVAVGVAIFGNGADTAGQEGLKITVLLVDNYELVEGR
jgi:hypothetical protein